MLFLPTGFDSNGRANAVTSGTVTSYYEGQAYVGNDPLVATGDVEASDVFHRGFRYTQEGALRVLDATEGLPDPVLYHEGIPMSNSGQVCYTTDAFDPDNVSYIAGMAISGGAGVYLEATGESPPVAEFSATPLTGETPLTVTFTDESTNTPSEWLWEKNDGGGWVEFEGTPTAQNPEEDLLEGDWSIRLTATNAAGSDSETKTDYIAVSGGSEYVGPLDLVPGAVVAYGVRALSAAWLGENIFRLRRASDDAEMDFAADAVTGDAPVAAITAWLDGSDGFLAGLYDQSGGGRDLLQSDSGSTQALFNPSLLGGKCGFEYKPENSGAALYSDPMTQFDWTSGEISFSAVFGNIEAGRSDFTFNDTDFTGSATFSSFAIYVVDTEENEIGASFNTGLYTPTVVDGGAIDDESPAELYKTGVSQEIGSNFSSGTPVGTIEAVNAYMSFIGGWCEYCVYDEFKSFAARTPLRENLATYYGITLP